MNFLYVIPARGGSKGIPHKNIKLLAGKPLIQYSVEVARSLSEDEYICVSTDDDEIIEFVEGLGLFVPFKRPAYLATDKSGTHEVLLHALEFYEERKGETFDGLVLLQPTSPLRTAEHVKHAIALFDSSIDVVVSVCESGQNPYYNLFEDDLSGYLKVSKGDGEIIRRQEAPPVWMFNGAIYIFNIDSLKQGYFDSYKKIRKFVMSSEYSLDLDTPFDWTVAESLLKK